MPYPFTNQREMKSLSSAPWLHNRQPYGWKRSSAIATEPKRESDCPARGVDQTGNGRHGEPDRSAGRYRTRHYNEGGYKTKSHGAAFDLTDRKSTRLNFSHRNLHSYPTRRSSDLTDGMANRTGQPGDIARDTTTKADIRRNPMVLRLT